MGVVDSVCSGLEHLRDRTAARAAAEEHQPKPGSVLLRQRSAPGLDRVIEGSREIAWMMIEHAADHITGFLLLVSAKDGIPNISALTTVRSMLESAAIGVWLSEAHISGTERAQRIYQFRVDAIIEQRKVAQESDLCSAADVRELQGRLAEVSKHACDYGLEQRLKNGKVIGVHPSKPKPTEMIRQFLHLQEAYRVLSGVAHGQHWAIRQFAFKQADPADLPAGVETPETYFERSISPELLRWLSAILACAFSRLFWSYSQFMGWHSAAGVRILERSFDTLSLPPEFRFWRLQ